MAHSAPEEFVEEQVVFVGGFSRMGASGPKLFFGAREAVGFEFDGVAVGGAANKDKVAIIGDKNLAVTPPVPADLFTFGGDPGVVGSSFDFDDATRGDLSGLRLMARVVLVLVFGEKTSVRNSGATVLDGENTLHLGLEGLPDFVEEVREGWIVGSFGDGFAGRTNVA